MWKFMILRAKKHYIIISELKFSLFISNEFKIILINDSFLSSNFSRTARIAIQTHNYIISHLRV